MLHGYAKRCDAKLVLEGLFENHQFKKDKVKYDKSLRIAKKFDVNDYVNSY